MIAPNVPALVIALLAAWRLDAVAVPLNARLRERELRLALEHAEVTLVVSVRESLGYRFDELLPRLLPDLPGLRACLFVDAGGSEEDVLAAEPTDFECERLPADVAALLYTSGTTGAPKGAVVPHARELAAAPELAAILELTPEDTAAFVVPISHAFGLSCLLASVVAGARAVLVESSFSAGPLLDAVTDRRATVLHGSPSLFGALLKARPEGLPTVRTGFVAGAAPSRELLERLEAAGMTILNLYGLTETGAVASCRGSDTAELRHTTAGRPLPGVELRVAEDGADRPFGELQVRGANLAPRYFRGGDEEAGAFTEGWFRTGDLAQLEGGYVRIAGRVKELVHVGGFNVFPAEVEAVLLSHADVVQAVVVGIPHEQTGEALHAFVVARPGVELTPASLLQFARPRIAGYKLPYGITVVSELPLLPSGKPDRLALAASVASAQAAPLGG